MDFISGGLHEYVFKLIIPDMYKISIIRIDVQIPNILHIQTTFNIIWNIYNIHII